MIKHIAEILYQKYKVCGIDINIVGTGRDAIESLNHRIPDLILLDLRLPDMTGMDVLHAVKKSHPDVPIIFMTAHGSIDTAVEAMRHGSQDFLIKPREADRLRVTVNNAIRKATKLKNEADNPGNQNYQGFIGSSQTMSPKIIIYYLPYWVLRIYIKFYQFSYIYYV